MPELTEDEKKKLKDKIITDLFKSNAIHAKVHGICGRNHIKRDTQIQQDVISETFYYLARFDTDTLIEMYNDNPDRLIGLSVRIAVWKGVAKGNKYPDYPGHSVASKLLFASNLSIKNVPLLGEPTSSGSSSDFYTYSLMEETLIDESTLEDSTKLFWALIIEELDKKEHELLEDILTPKHKRGKHTKDYTDAKNALIDKIKSIVDKHKIKIVTTNYVESNLNKQKQKKGKLIDNLLNPKNERKTRKSRKAISPKGRKLSKN